MTLTTKQKKKLSKSLKQKWASGTRKPNPAGYGDKISAALKIAHAEGRMHVITHDAAMKGLACRDMDKVREQIKALAESNRGKSMPPGPSAKGPGHHKSRYWVFTNKALGATLEGWNLSHLVRENAHLFDDDDLAWKKSRCRATRGIRSLYAMNKTTGRPQALSWRGWMAVNVTDEPI